MSAALRLLRLLAGQHGDEHNMAAAVGQRVGHKRSVGLLRQSRRIAPGVSASLVAG